MGVERIDCRNWDEDAYRESILGERETLTRTVFRATFAPNANPNPNSDHIATASSDGSVASYSISSCLALHVNFEVCFIFREKYAIFVCWQAYGCGTARGKNWLTAEPNFLTQGHDGPAYDVKFYGEEDDSLLLSCGDDGRIRGWKWKEIMGSEAPQGGKLKPVLDLVNPQHKGPWGALSPIPENNAMAVDCQRGFIYAAAGDSRAYCWDVEKCEVKTVFKGHSNYLHCIAACKLSNQIITGSEDGTARIWDCTSGKCTQIIDPIADKRSNTSYPCVSCIAIDSSESWLARDYAACGKGQSLSLWNLPARECVFSTTTNACIQDVLCDDNQILAAGAEPLLTRFNMSGEIISQIQCAPRSVFSISLHPSGVTAVSGYGAIVDIILQFGSHSCTFRCRGI